MTTPTSPAVRLENRSALATAGRHSAALAHLALLAGGGITQLLASTHATIARRPALDGDSEPPQRAPAAYRLVAQTFFWLAGLSRQLGTTLPGDSQTTLFHSALNGVLGDTLAAHENPLCQELSLRDEAGRELDPVRWQEEEAGPVVLFLHGLCLSEREWQTPAQKDFVGELRERGYRVAWVRYNTGRPIHESGADLHALLETLATAGATEFTLIGHSMGGLVLRAAAHHADANDASWLPRLAQAAYLGTPHQGAPLERVGHLANSVLGLTPYTRPLMQLGDVRSSGIRDLRHGRISPDDEIPLTLPAQARHLLVAGQLGTDYTRHWLGDGLVPVRSALGEHRESERAITGGDITRVEFSGLGHMAMLGDERVYTALREWLLTK